MVKVADIERDLRAEGWLAALTERLSDEERALVARAHAYAQQSYGERRHPSGQPWFEHACGAAGVLGAMRLDAETLAAALLLGIALDSEAQRESVQRQFGGGVVGLIGGVAAMAPIQALRPRLAATAQAADKAGQLEALRKMLLAMVQDVRVVLIKLADHIQLLREVVGAVPTQAGREAAEDAFELLAPLANRLGVWQLKWELEDLAFRCVQPDTYKAIARDLDEKRVDREAYIAAVIVRLRTELQRAGLRAEITGRPKHIFSIWKKMQRKGVAFERLSDVLAVRVLVGDVGQCYAALGLVHQLWTPIPGEFDDYIAKPKANDYRSLHTAVVGPDQKVLEVQIRTQEMHQHAELGVAAHWRYKESAQRDAAYERKIAWLRQILDWRDELADAAQLAESFRSELREDSVYVLTPAGRVIDLPQGATPIDFAYHVHTELGHRCRGAKVNGQIVPLTHRLANGAVVEIIAAKEGGPSRDWLNAQLGYLKSNRSRAKVRQWFNSQAHDEAVAQGRAALDKDLHRLARAGIKHEDLAKALHFDQPEALYLAYQKGEITLRELQAAVRAEPAPASVEPVLPVAAPAPSRSADGVLVVGVDRLLTVLARCCKPAPPDPIVGFVSRGRGVSVHRTDCPNARRLPPERLMPADWGRIGPEQRFAVDLEIRANAHPMLMRDILDLLARARVKVLSSRSTSQELDARMLFTLEVPGLDHLYHLIDEVRELSGVTSVRRR